MQQIRQLVRDKAGNVYLSLGKGEKLTHWEDTKILITGIGNSGTNLFTEVVRASGMFNFTEFVEDRMSWCGQASGLVPLLTKNYGAKMACQKPYFTIKDFDRNMEKFPNLYVLVSIRHPLDTSLSNIYRELPLVMGGDSKENKPEDVCTDNARIDDLINLWKTERAPTLFYVLDKYADTGRVTSVKLENLITSPELVARNIARWLGIPYNNEMSNPWNKVRHEGQQNRYCGVLDKTQVYKYKRWKETYDGYYSDKKELVIRLAKGLAPISTFFGYETEECHFD